eukprot:NODE_865_length_1124_cov_712.561860_g705_i0.p1 GENE.NODE_865_length_1124_cov_712.561860_g705_i0~~NODE_865_length_1124_cov_712.561860_g705_i0.p1  ORF type:complete len:156 (-),score=69.52 NODE_865_length_1124_cov_712.561860_g705_i0:571-1038(-)
MADETEVVEQIGAGASSTFPQQAGALKKGDHCVIKGRPVKIVEITTSKTGKHGHAKAHIVALDIFTGKKLEELCPTTHNMLCPNVTRKEYQVTDVHDGYVNLLDDDGVEKNDLKIPTGDVGEQMVKQFEAGTDLVVTVISSMGEQMIMQVKENTN